MNSDRYTYASFAAQAIPADRAGFIRRTYTHLAGAIFAFALLEMAAFQTSLPDTVMQVLGQTRYTWLIVMAAFMGVSYLANKWASSDTSVELQYAGLGAYVVAETIIFMPLLWMAERIAGPSAIQSAALLTLALFTGLTATVLVTQKDFSFLRSILMIGGFISMGVIVASILFGFQLGVLFSAIMVLMAAGFILYDTSNVLHNYRVTQHVAASLALFASVALMFWYVLRLFIGFGGRSND